MSLKLTHAPIIVEHTIVSSPLLLPGMFRSLKVVAVRHCDLFSSIAEHMKIAAPFNGPGIKIIMDLGPDRGRKNSGSLWLDSGLDLDILVKYVFYDTILIIRCFTTFLRLARE